MEGQGGVLLLQGEMGKPNVHELWPVQRATTTHHLALGICGPGFQACTFQRQFLTKCYQKSAVPGHTYVQRKKELMIILSVHTHIP